MATTEVFDLPVGYWRCEGQFINTLCLWDEYMRQGGAPTRAQGEFFRASLKSPYVLMGLILLIGEGLPQAISTCRTVGICLESENDVLLPEGLEPPAIPGFGSIAKDEDTAAAAVLWFSNRRGTKPHHLPVERDLAGRIDRLQPALFGLEEGRILALQAFVEWMHGNQIEARHIVAVVRELTQESGTPDDFVDELLKVVEEGPVLWKKLENWKEENV